MIYPNDNRSLLCMETLFLLAPIVICYTISLETYLSNRGGKEKDSLYLEYCYSFTYRKDIPKALHNIMSLAKRHDCI